MMANATNRIRTRDQAPSPHTSPTLERGESWPREDLEPPPTEADPTAPLDPGEDTPEPAVHRTRRPEV